MPRVRRRSINDINDQYNRIRAAGASGARLQGQGTSHKDTRKTSRTVQSGGMPSTQQDNGLMSITAQTGIFVPTVQKDGQRNMAQPTTCGWHAVLIWGRAVGLQPDKSEKHLCRDRNQLATSHAKRAG